MYLSDISILEDIKKKNFEPNFSHPPPSTFGHHCTKLHLNVLFLLELINGTRWINCDLGWTQGHQSPGKTEAPVFFYLSVSERSGTNNYCYECKLINSWKYNNIYNGCEEPTGWSLGILRGTNTNVKCAWREKYTCYCYCHCYCYCCFLLLLLLLLLLLKQYVLKI